ncbi:MAG: ribosome biogenesis GTP-binding protein YihA/YsxC [Bacteroidales bacterium]|jgi:GTP-binding protein|nr:ribosome biogenesis GTP-binding protein YihA/YsxC [Bacteroidales bacterium]
MEIKEARFIISNTDVKKCPVPNKPEYAFIGRSNVGKSSLINMLTNKKSLAKTSGKPGKTQVINHFLVNEEWYLVDLPGYGYAKVPTAERKKWEKFIRKYILERENLYCLFVLIDSRHEPQTVDIEFMEWLGTNKISFVMVFTKIDKLNTGELDENIKVYEKKMQESWDEMPCFFITSAETRQGKTELLNFIDKINRAEQS